MAVRKGSFAPGWCLCLAAVLLGLLLPTLAHADISNAGVLDEVLDRYRAAAQGWGNAVQGAATTLFWSLATISMVWTFSQLAMRSADLMEILAEFVRYMFFTGFYWWLLENAVPIGESIIASMRQLGATAGGVENALSPSTVLDVGFEIVFTVWEQTTVLQPLDSAVLILMALGILIVLALVAVNMLVLLISSWVLAYAGIFYLGFGGSRWTSEMAIGYYKLLLSIATQLFAMLLLVGIAQSFLDSYYEQMAEGVGFEEMAVMLVVVICLLAICNKVPSLVGGLATGASAHQALAPVAGAGTALGVAGFAAAAASTGAAMVVSGAANAVGGWQAVRAATGAARSALGAGGGASGGPSGGTGPLATALGTTATGPSASGSVATSSKGASLPPSAASTSARASTSSAGHAREGHAEGKGGVLAAPSESKIAGSNGVSANRGRSHGGASTSRPQANGSSGAPALSGSQLSAQPEGARARGEVATPRTESARDTKPGPSVPREATEHGAPEAHPHGSEGASGAEEQSPTSATSEGQSQPVENAPEALNSSDAPTLPPPRDTAAEGDRGLGRAATGVRGLWTEGGSSQGHSPAPKSSAADAAPPVAAQTQHGARAADAAAGGAPTRSATAARALSEYPDSWRDSISQPQLAEATRPVPMAATAPAAVSEGVGGGDDRPRAPSAPAASSSQGTTTPGDVQKGAPARAAASSLKVAARAAQILTRETVTHVKHAAFGAAQRRVDATLGGQIAAEIREHHAEPPQSLEVAAFRDGEEPSNALSQGFVPNLDNTRVGPNRND